MGIFSKRGAEALKKIVGTEEVSTPSVETLSADVKQGVIQLPVNDIAPSPYQPRILFNDENLASLSESLKEQGVLQPLIVRKTHTGFELVAGERRLRAAKLAGLTAVPAIMKELDDKDAMILSLTENLQREDLSVVEKTLAIGLLKAQIGDTEATARALALTKRSIERYARIYSVIGASDTFLSVSKKNAHLIDFRDAEALANIGRYLLPEEFTKFFDLVKNEGIKRAIKHYRNPLRPSLAQNSGRQPVRCTVKETETCVRLQIRYEKGEQLKGEDKKKLQEKFDDFLLRIEKPK
jgi:ParB family chromosome partitioning protein